MKLIIIVGSARTDGVSARMVRFVQNYLNGRAEVTPLWLRDYRIEFCDADNACELKDCCVNDDVKYITESMQASDAILYMPVMHAYGTNSRFQAFLERVGYGFLRPRKRPLRDKLAAVAVIGRRYGHTGVFGQIVLNVLLNNMIMVGSGFPATIHSQMTRDLEGEEALRSTLDRLVECYYAFNEKPRHASQRLRLLQQIERQTG